MQFFRAPVSSELCNKYLKMEQIDWVSMLQKRRKLLQQYTSSRCLCHFRRFYATIRSRCKRFSILIFSDWPHTFTEFDEPHRDVSEIAESNDKPQNQKIKTSQHRLSSL